MKKEVLDEKPRIRQIKRTGAGKLIVHVEGRDEPVEEAAIARCFPWSVPDCYVSVRDKDGKEVVLLDSLEELDEDSRRVAEEELRERIFNPKIQRIVDFKYEFGITTITAETDRGQVSFQVGSRDDVRSLSATRALFRDVDGNTYELPDMDALDATSQKHLQSFF